MKEVDEIINQNLDESALFENSHPEKSEKSSIEGNANNRVSPVISLSDNVNKEIDLNHVEVQVNERPRLAVSHMLSKYILK
jgi:hypothetical protein